MVIDPAQIELTGEQRQRLAQLAERTGKDWTELVDELLDAVPAALKSQPVVKGATNGRTPEKSLFDVLSERGILGCFDGPTDRMLFHPGQG